MKIVLSTLNSKYIHSSLALRYLKEYNKRDFPNIEMVEYTIKEPLNNILSDLFQKRPDVIGLSCYIWNIEETINLVSLIRKVMPNVKIILGGPEVSFDLTYWLKNVQGIDFIVYGEGELTLNQLLKSIDNNISFDSVKGIAFIDDNNIKINPPQEKINLNDIPNPYTDNDLLTLKDKIIYFESSRGCPFSCSYCLSSVDTGVRFFDLDRVKNDLKKLIDAEVKTIKFVDRTFNLSKKYSMEIFKFLIENHKKTIFQFEITADVLKPEVLDYLIENTPKGLFRFEIGVQTTNEYTNSLVNRRQNFNKLSDTVIKLKKNKNIDQHLDLIAGLPEEDYNSFRKTFNDVFALKAEELQLGFLKLLRGTQIWIEAKKYDYTYMDKAPYEVLSNNVLTYNDIIKIKRVEDILEKYWNSHRMDNTIEYLLENEFSSPFDFFQEFGDYWDGKGWNKIGHQLESLFLRLEEFLEQVELNNKNLANSLMKLDYFLNHNNKPRKIWWEFQLSKKEQSMLLEDILKSQDTIYGLDDFRSLNLTEKNLHKHIMIDTSEYDIFSFLTEKEIRKQNTLIIIYYDSINKPKYYFKRLEES